LTLAFHPPGEVHAEEFGEGPSRSFNVEIEPGWINRFSLPASLLDGWADTRGGPLASLALRLYREFRQPDAVSSLAVEGLMLELFAVAFREKASTIKQPPPWLKRTWEMVQTRFAEPLALGDVAAEVGVHPVHLAATFRRTYHCTVGEAIRRRRVEFASHQLAHSDAPLAVIALEAGFADQSHFCNVFKRQVGLSPAEFRRSLRTP
jgi:AraC family transcriptional regulator